MALRSYVKPSEVQTGSVMMSAVIGHTYASGTTADSLASDGPAAPPLPPSPPPAHIPAYIRSKSLAPAFAFFADVAALAAPAAARSADNAALVAAAHARARSAASSLDSSWSAFSCRHAASCRAASCRAASFRAASCRHASFLSCGAGASSLSCYDLSCRESFRPRACFSRCREGLAERFQIKSLASWRKSSARIAATSALL